MYRDIYKKGIIRYSYHLAWPISPKVNISTVFTYKCSMGCPYCNQLKEKKNKNVLNLKLYKYTLEKIIKETKKYTNNFAFNFLGGELSELEISYNLEILEIVFNLIKKYNLKTEITWLSNFSQDIKYYQKIYNAFYEYQNKYYFNFELLFSIHSIYLKNYGKDYIINKLKDLFKNKKYTQNTCIKLFGKNLAKEFINNLKPLSPSFEIGDLNFISYDKNFKKNYKKLRSVKCFNFNYDITPDNKIINQCGKTYNFLNFKSNDIKSCGKICPIGDFEYNVYKELK